MYLPPRIEYSPLIEHRQSAHEAIGAGAEVLVVDAALARVHCHEWVLDDVLEERAEVDLA
jgi:hypothetical protein